MKFLLTIKSFFKKFNSKKAGKEPSDLASKDFFKIKDEIQISDINVSNEGINFKVNYHGSVVPFWLACDGEISAEKSNLKVQNALSSIAIGLTEGLNLVEISQSLREKY